MTNLTINGFTVTVDDGATILQAAQQAGVSIPTLCALRDVNEIAACRICLVEVDGEERLVPACSTHVAEGMAVRTNTPRVLEARRGVLELILSEHDTSCTTCLRNGTCALQSLCADMGLVDIPYVEQPPFSDWDWSFPLWRDSSKCLRCMRCVSICSKIQGCGVWGVDEADGIVAVRDGLSIRNASCTLCGQCIAQCPTGALVARDDTYRVMNALADPDTVVVVTVAPAVRTSWGEGLGVGRDVATIGRLVAACRRMGFDYVFDVDFGADMTIMEEGSEFLAALGKAEKPAFPLFTSCCPAWVRYVKQRYPQFVGYLSSSKSPHEMLAAVIKTYFADEVLHVDRKRVFTVSVMPCVSKKYEVGVDALDSAGTGHDVDVSLTVREFDRLVRRFGLAVEKLDEEPFDEPLGLASGGGHIFGRSGGVMEAALRTASKLTTGNVDYRECAVIPAAEDKPWMEKTIQLGEREVSLAVLSGLDNARQLIEALQRGDCTYDFVEVMACPGGCVGGGGQPITFNESRVDARAAVSNAIDVASDVRCSCDNPAIQKLYADFLGEPLEGKAHELLHTDQATWAL